MDWSSTRSTNGLIMEEERVSMMAGWAALSAKEKRGKKLGEIFFDLKSPKCVAQLSAHFFLAFKVRT